jgi:hypothetical protein
MTTVPVLLCERRWVCPNCATQSVTKRADVHQQMHHCPGLNGFIAPMVEAHLGKVKVEAVERGDYVNGDHVQYMEKDGKQVPIMSVVTTRDDGQDCAVYAPAATLNARAD